MIDISQKTEIDPEVVRKLSANGELWFAAHDDGAKNRINGETVLEAASYGTPFGVLAALFMWIRKKFRNRGKTQEDFAAEKEAAVINRTCGALEAMLMEYIRSAQEGKIDGETLDELIITLEQMQRFDQDGKLLIPGKKELTEIRKYISDCTASIAGGESVPPAEAAGLSEFGMIRELLMQQKALARS